MDSEVNYHWQSWQENRVLYQFKKYMYLVLNDMWLSHLNAPNINKTKVTAKWRYELQTLWAFKK